jgi:cytochrome P450
MPMNPPQYDPNDPGVLENPWPVYAQMRERCPVHHHADPVHPFYTVFRAEDVRSVSSDAGVWSSRYSSAPVFMKAVGVMQDGQAHAEFRRLFALRLMPQAVERHRGLIEGIANTLIDRMLEKSRGCLHDDFACPLPVKVIASLLGIPAEDNLRFKKWSDELAELGFGQDSERYSGVYAEVAAFFSACLEQRRQALAAAGVAEAGPEHLGGPVPDDLISVLLVSKYQGRRLTEHEMQFTLIGLMIGGNETTTSLITNCLWRLLEAPPLWERLKREPALIETAIEESLRLDAPTLGMWRTSLCPVTLHGVEIPAKSKMMMAYGSANRDPAVFDHPDTFDLDRPLAQARRHLSFGTGPHTCPGGPLSRLEARIALRLFIERLPDLRLNGPHTRIKPFNFWGRRSMPVAW